MYLFIHRCDLRLYDNTTIHHLIENKIAFQPIFIFTPEQILPKNEYRSEHAIQFMVESLADLANQYQEQGIKFKFYFGDVIEVLTKLIKDNEITGIAFNLDYSPYAVERDEKIRNLAKKMNLESLTLEDKLLNPVSAIKTDKDTVYTKFTPFYKKGLKYNQANPVPKPLANKITLHPDKMSKNKFEIDLKKIRKYYQENDNLAVRGGRENALKILNHLSDFKDYNQNRNTPSIQTTRLSAYLKFGCVSIRELYHKTLEKLGNKNELLVQYYWRDFYSMILFNFNQIVKGVITRPEFRLIDWDYDKEKFRRWCEGMTGCPIVDAGMRQMNQTGFMENRVRMIVATFLIFYLKIDWEYGMKYFSQKLVDADWANNVGNWQWTAGIEKWSNDYYRVFSMESQIKRFDPDCVYIKTWVPELKDVPAKEIADWDLNHYEVKGYPEPIISNNKQARMDGIAMYKKAIQKYKNN